MVNEAAHAGVASVDPRANNAPIRLTPDVRVVRLFFIVSSFSVNWPPVPSTEQTAAKSHKQQATISQKQSYGPAENSSGYKQRETFHESVLSGHFFGS
jgi:hypothetical protein